MQPSDVSPNGRLISRITSGGALNAPWGLLPGTATNGGTDALWFTSGINHEQNGLLGVLRP